MPAKISLKLDSLFSSYADALVVPRSTTGTISNSIKNDVRNVLRIEIPESLPYEALGTLSITKYNNIQRQNNLKPIFHLLMATSVDNDTSTYAAIEKIAKAIAEFTVRNPGVRDVATPLLGTGSGNLDPLKVYELLASNFIKYAADAAVLEIYTDNEVIYQSIRNRESPRPVTRLPETVPLTDDLKTVMEDVLDRVLRERDVYIVGASWNKQDQSARFFEQGIWENGNEDKFNDLVKQIKPGSLILLKSTFAQGDVSYLRIKGIGIVTSNAADGIKLGIDWKIYGVQYDLPDMGSHRSTIAKINNTVSKQIIKAIKDWASVIFAMFPPDNEVYTPEMALQLSKIAALSSDADDGEDYLDIQADIDAFAKIMAAKSFRPPLAVALFGKWGTGKSFFIKKLKGRVDYFSQKPDSNLYYKGIAQIHFNAWSYLDANLWAGIVDRIFEGLTQYIGDHTASEAEVELVRSALVSELSAGRQEVTAITAQKGQVELHIAGLQSQKEDLQGKLAAKKTAFKKDAYESVIKTVNEKLKVAEQIKTAIQSNGSLIAAEKELKEVVPESYWSNPDEAYKQVKSASAFLTVFFRKSKFWSNIAWLAVIILFVYFAPLLLEKLKDVIGSYRVYIIPFQVLVPTLGLLLPLAKRIWDTAKEFKPLTSSLWKIKNDYDQAIKLAMITVNEEYLQVQRDIEQAEKEIGKIDVLILEKNEKLGVLDYNNKHGLVSEALYGFIGKRSRSDDYQRHLGIVSTIRKDFEALSNLLAGHQEENQREGFQKYFDYPLNRIILYIDDLDRCPENMVVEVLEAVNLLMAFPLFIVVVGVDQRWVKNALIKKYHFQFTGSEEHLPGNYAQIDATDYLEKIFQVPFHLKAATDVSIKTMIRSLSQPEGPFDFSSEEAIYDDDSPLVRDAQSDADTEEPSAPAPSETTPASVPQAEHLTLSAKEVSSMEDMSAILGNNPRTIKRFVNVYQIVRAHAGLTYMAREQEKEYLVVMFLLALENGCFRKIAPSFIKFMHGPQNDIKTLNAYLQVSDEKSKEVVHLKKELYLILTNKTNYQILIAEPMATFKKHNQFVQRFSFDEVVTRSVIPEEE